MRDIYTAYSTEGAKTLLDEGYKVKRHSWNGSYFCKIGDRYYSIVIFKNIKVDITENLDILMEMALQDEKGDIDWTIC